MKLPLSKVTEKIQRICEYLQTFPEPLDFLWGGGKMDAKSPLLSQWKDRQASRKAVTQGGKPGRGRQLHFALQPFLSCGNRASAPKGQPVQGYGEACGGDAGFSGNHRCFSFWRRQCKAWIERASTPKVPNAKRRTSHLAACAALFCLSGCFSWRNWEY